jgi:fructose-specific phosphotransferase system component IIB
MNRIESLTTQEIKKAKAVLIAANLGHDIAYFRITKAEAIACLDAINQGIQDGAFVRIGKDKCLYIN